MTNRERQVLALIREDPLISQQTIADRLGISRSAVAGHIMKMTAKGVIKGRGYVYSDSPFVVVVGGANVDIHGAPLAKLRQHDSNPGMVHTSPGGVARNIAENLARLGNDCRLVAPVGDDHHGRLLLQQGAAAGINTQHMLQIDEQKTSTYLSILNEDGDMQVGVSDMAILDFLNAERLQVHEQMFRQAAMLVIDTNLSEEALAYLSDTFSKQVIFADTVSTTKAVKIKPCLNSVHTLTPSLIEAEAISGLRARTEKQLPKLAGWFHDQGVQRVFVTLGAGGVFYSTEGNQGIEKIQQTDANIANAGGAGDAFVAGLVHAWLRSWALLPSTRFALSAAQLTLSHAATISPTMSVSAVKRHYENQYAEKVA